MNPLESVKGTIIAGIVLSVLVTAIAAALGFAGGAMPSALTIDRWIHVVAGITWIGLLYYFNFVQVPAMADATADKDGPGPAAIGKYVAPRALFWFRWAALITWVSGAYYLAFSQHGLHETFTLGLMNETTTANTFLLGLGAWMGTIMLFNVWVLIWPNQKKVLGLVPASDDEKAKAKRTAFLASRTNTLLSFPMLVGMVAGSHGAMFWF